MSMGLKTGIGRVGAAIAVSALSAALLATGASADDRGPDTPEGGQHTGPVQFWGEGNDQCEVSFTIVNETNSTYYQIDYVIDDEEPNGPDWGTGQIGRLNGHSIADAPVVTNPVTGGPKYVTNREPLSDTTTYVLTDLPNLPNPDADSHTVYYRMILGTDGKDRGDGRWYKTEVTGCAEPEECTSGSLGSSSGSAGSLGIIRHLMFGSLHHHGSHGATTAGSSGSAGSFGEC